MPEDLLGEQTNLWMCLSIGLVFPLTIILHVNRNQNFNLSVMLCLAVCSLGLDYFKTLEEAVGFRVVIRENSVKKQGCHSKLQLLSWIRSIKHSALGWILSTISKRQVFYLLKKYSASMRCYTVFIMKGYLLFAMQTTEEGTPLLDWGHVIEALNKVLISQFTVPFCCHHLRRSF